MALLRVQLQRVYLLAATCFCLSLLSFFWINESDDSSEKFEGESIGGSSNEVLKKESGAVVPEPRVNTDQEYLLSFEQIDSSYLEHIEAIDSFAAQHGVFTEEELAEYASYPDELLEQMSIGGDLLAMELLADNAIAMGQTDVVKDIYTVSAVHGGTMGLTYLALHRFYEGVNGDSITDMDSVLDAFAYLELAAIRGNLNTIRTGIYLIDEHSLRLSSEEVSEISSRAEIMYGELSDIRKELGLQPFDNAISITMLIGLQEDFPLEKNPSGWGMQYYQ